LRERLPSRHPLCRALALAADQFLVRRGELRTIVAGYPWFVDWGRDAMISLPGLCLATGRAEEAKPILRAFARAVADGLLPNRFPEEGEEPEYNTVDAGLWFVVAIHRYLKATGDEAFVLGELLPVVREMVAWHQRGTRHGIRQDADGLLLAGEPGVQLTWMDARVGERVVTPRHGKPVEVNALWVNALAILAELEGRAGNADTALAWAEQAARARKRFAEVFWNPERRCLYDVVAEDAKDASLRPNQLLALALPYPLLEGEEARAVLEAVESQLSTPWGLRTLAAGEPGYEPRYQGGPAERDGAYHQGTVWPWLLGPYLTALVRLRGEVGREQGRQLFEALEPALAVATVGTVAEIFDAEPPHRPHGAFAQAWSVAELLRAALDDLGLGARP
nr:amylo-alpha-1,6-glucosidase [Thermoanaerobaculia bacterium]